MLAERRKALLGGAAELGAAAAAVEDSAKLSGEVEEGLPIGAELDAAVTALRKASGRRYTAARQNVPVPLP